MSQQGVDPGLHTFHSPHLESVVLEAIDFLNSTPIHPLPPSGRFGGVGVYALYYLGNSPYYNYIAKLNREQCTQPMYVGKAVPPGWRTARSSKSVNQRPLYSRLRQHTNSISKGEGIKAEEFRCRFILLDGIEMDLIASIEAQLIRTYRPLWNAVIDGFGNHDPGKGRYDQAPSEWDVLHPGRSWLKKLTGTPPSLDRIASKIDQYRVPS